jgi:CO dehydrogenase maturation factor
MSYIIAVSGKGGVGKTTVSSLLVRQLIQNGKTPVLAIDADPNSCLDAALGVKAERTVGRVREEAKSEISGMTSGISKM